jgi:hypothetical protein
MGERQRPEVLVLHGHATARTRDASHLAHHRERIRDVEQHGHRERDVEPVVSERELRTVAVAQVDAGAAAVTPRGRQHGAARIDPRHATAAADERDEIAQDDAGAAPHLEHGVAAADRDRAQEPLAEPSLRGIAPAGFQRLDEGGGIGRAIDLAVGVRVRHASRRAHASLQKYRGPSGPCRLTARDRTT